MEWVKRGQKILGALLWLSTRTRPDIACAVSLAAQALWQDLETLKVRLRHLLQYLNTTQTFGLMYLYPPKESTSTLTEFTAFSDSSFSPSGKGSQSGFVILLSFGNVRHLVHWHSTREKKMAESSAESELYAMSTTFKTARNFRLLVQELLNPEILLNLRCDNKATIAMLDEPSWRTRYISIYGETIRREMLQKSLIVTFVTTDVQLADPLTKPTTTKINDNLLALLGLVAHNHAAGIVNAAISKREKTLIAVHSASAWLRAQMAECNALSMNNNLNNKQ